MSIVMLKKITMTNFRGVKHKEITFNGDTRILGENGAGKSTVANAWLWLMSDTDYAITKNPNITPLGMTECISEVEAELEIDGKPCKVSKSQKYKEKTDDSGKTTSSVTNTYSINDVEKSQKDFFADMTERGVNMDRFLIFSNPNAFTADTSKQGREKMRNVLFEMANDISDADIVAEMSEIDELKELLANYKIDEVEQMQKSTLKKILDSCGKDNAIINGRISGMLDSKVEVDIKALEVEKTAIQGEIDTLQAEIDGIGNNKADIERTISSLKKDRADELSKASTELKRSEADLEFKLVQIDTEKAKNNSEIYLALHEIESIEKQIKNNQESLDNWRDLYKKVQDEVLDEKDLKCPTCGRTLPDDEIEEIKSNFASSKNERMNSYKARGEDAKAAIVRLQADLKEKNELLNVLKEQGRKISGEEDKVKAKLSEIPPAPTRTEETDIIDKKIDALMASLKTSDNDALMELNSKMSAAKDRLQKVIGDIAVGERNSEIDAKVEELREERRMAEINRANAEKILDMVSRFKKFKNDKLSESINKHFTIAQFRLFKVLKNGSIEEACDVLIDGKEINSQANQSLQVLARLDILKGLSDFFNEHYPVFADDFALFTSNSEDRIKLDSQLIKLIATDGIKELEIKEG